MTHWLYEQICYYIYLNKEVDYFEIIPLIEYKFRQRFKLKRGNYDHKCNRILCFRAIVDIKEVTKPNRELGDEEADSMLKDFTPKKEWVFYEKNSKHTYIQFMSQRGAIIRELGDLVQKAQWEYSTGMR